jgi:hypothetical protein
MISVTAVLTVATLILTSPPAADAMTPVEHLSRGEAILRAINTEPLKKDAQKQIGALRENFSGLVAAYRINSDPFIPPAISQPTSASGDPLSAPPNWREKFSDVENDLSRMLGGVSRSASSEIHRALQEFRLELELFFAAAISGVNEVAPPSTPAVGGEVVIP